MAQRTVLNIGGTPLISISAAINAEKSNNVCIFVLHGRGGSKDDMAEFGERMWTALTDTVHDKNFWIILPDHRNHGARLISDTQNRGWKHNSSHHTDMYAMQYGTASDISYLIKFIPLVLGICFETWIAVGYSMGGHAALMAYSHGTSFMI